MLYDNSGTSPGELKANFNNKGADNLSWLIYLLLTGKDIFKHYHPKDEEGYLFRVLRGDFSSALPYGQLISACREFSMMIPVESAYSSFYNNGIADKRRQNQIQKSAMVIQGQYGQLNIPTATMLVELRSDIRRILLELIKEYEDIRINNQGRSKC